VDAEDRDLAARAFPHLPQGLGAHAVFQLEAVEFQRGQRIEQPRTIVDLLRVIDLDMPARPEYAMGC
jgi:hypothetical protein